jgi:hypothetical protein
MRLHGGIQHSLKNKRVRASRARQRNWETERGQPTAVYSKLVPNDQPSCGNLAGRWQLVSALLAVGMGGPSRPPSPRCWGRFRFLVLAEIGHSRFQNRPPMKNQPRSSNPNGLDQKTAPSVDSQVLGLVHCSVCVHFRSKAPARMPCAGADSCNVRRPMRFTLGTSYSNATPSWSWPRCRPDRGQQGAILINC